MLHFTKHAREKMNVRRINIRTIEEVLNRPEHRFYDTLRNSEVLARRVMLRDEVITMVVAFTRRNGDYTIITVYPSKQFEEEVDRKVKSGRWVIIKGGTYEG